MNASKKYHIILQGITSNNISETCRDFGISRTLYYRWYDAYKKYGMEGLADKERKPQMPNKVDKKIEKMILQYVEKFPEDGPKRIYYELHDEGVKVGETGIYNVLRRNGLSQRTQRELYAQHVKEKKRLESGNCLKTISPKREEHPDYQLKNSQNAHPGYICLQCIHYMGNFPTIGKVYQYVIYDVYSKMGIVKLYHQKNTIQVIDFMQTKIIPLMKTFNLTINYLVTSQGREFSNNWDRGRHIYSEFLQRNDIKQVTCSIENHEIFQPLHTFLAVITTEFYEQVWCDDKISSFEELEQQMNEYIKYYNFNREIREGGNVGKTPSEVFLECLNQQDPLPLWWFTRR